MRGREGKGSGGEWSEEGTSRRGPAEGLRGSKDRRVTVCMEEEGVERGRRRAEEAMLRVGVKKIWWRKGEETGELPEHTIGG